MMRPIAFSGWVIAAAIVAVPVDGRQAAHTPEAWMRAVGAHQAGRADDSATFVAAWTDTELNEALERLRRSVDRVKRAADGGGKDAAALNRTIRHAAVLHADLAILLPASSNWQSRGASTIVVRDGEVAGRDQRNVHWEIGRALIELLQPDPTADDFARLWYDATAAHLIEQSHWSDAVPHIERARQLFPADAKLALYLGAAHETFASPRIQRAFARAPLSSNRAAIDSEDGELRQAARLFQRALELDPTLVEASVRLAHVFIEQERFQEASERLQLALPSVTAPMLRYDALVLLGRAQENLARRAEARASYQAALELFPTAQTPHLSLAQLSWNAGARSDALQQLTILSAPLVESRRADPWWVYLLSHFPSSSELLAEVRGRLAAQDAGKQP
jgi:tetratricopeptide (TPR) repeat protein